MLLLFFSLLFGVLSCVFFIKAYSIRFTEHVCTAVYTEQYGCLVMDWYVNERRVHTSVECGINYVPIVEEFRCFSTPDGYKTSATEFSSKIANFRSIGILFAVFCFFTLIVVIVLYKHSRREQVRRNVNFYNRRDITDLELDFRKRYGRNPPTNNINFLMDSLEKIVPGYVRPISMEEYYTALKFKTVPDNCAVCLEPIVLTKESRECVRKIISINYEADVKKSSGNAAVEYPLSGGNAAVEYPLSCGHWFHTDCIKSVSVCPLCKSEFYVFEPNNIRSIETV